LQVKIRRGQVKTALLEKVGQVVDMRMNPENSPWADEDEMTTVLHEETARDSRLLAFVI
jgi:hypothetical protein